MATKKQQSKRKKVAATFIVYGKRVAARVRKAVAERVLTSSSRTLTVKWGA